MIVIIIASDCTCQEVNLKTDVFGISKSTLHSSNSSVQGDLEKIEIAIVVGRDEVDVLLGSLEPEGDVIGVGDLCG